MANRRVVPESRTCPIDGVVFEVGGRGRRDRGAIYCSVRCVNAHRNSVNPHAGSSAPRPRKALDTVHDEAWLRARYLDDGMGTPAIARLAGVSMQSVLFAMRKFGIKRRSIGAARRLRDVGRVRKVVTKAEMVAAYGGRCACCGETELVFLSLDHSNGGGSRHRQEIGGSRKLLQFLRAAGWPTDGYRVLCMNCQFGTRLGRNCPHQVESQPA